MLPNEVINHMDADELRNYVVHLGDVEDAKSDLVFAGNELIETLQRAYNNLSYKMETLSRHNLIMGRLRELESQYAEKYDEYMPKPVCGYTCKMPEGASE